MSMAKNPQVVTPAAKVKTTNARTVTVFCKVHNGLILQLQKKADVRVADKESSTGYRIEQQWVPKVGARRFYVDGPAYPVGTLPKGFPRQPVVEGGYAITRGIPADFWEEWAEQNRLADYCIPRDGAPRGMIYAEADMDTGLDLAREMEGQRSGMEPLSTDTDKDGRLTDPRLPRPLSSQLARLGPEPLGGGGSGA